MRLCTDGTRKYTHFRDVTCGVESKSLCERWKSGNKKKVKTKLMPRFLVQAPGFIVVVFNEQGRSLRGIVT